MTESSRKVSSRPKPLSIIRSLEEKYVAAMKKLQFGEFPYLFWDVQFVLYACTFTLYMYILYYFFYTLHMGAPNAVNACWFYFVHTSAKTTPFPIDFLLSPNTRALFWSPSPV